MRTVRSAAAWSTRLTVLAGLVLALIALNAPGMPDLPPSAPGSEEPLVGTLSGVAPGGTAEAGRPTSANGEPGHPKPSEVEAWLAEQGLDTPTEERPTPEPDQDPPRPLASAPARISSGSAAPAVSARGAVVLDEDSMAVLHGVNEDVSMPPASLTKVVTAVLAIESGMMDDVIAVDVDSNGMPGSSLMGLLPGDEFTIRDLVYGLMLVSGNDAALAIGRHLAGSDEAFMAQINEFMNELGMDHTHFTNPHGLHDDEHYASPRDLAVLARHAMQLPEFVEIVNARYWAAEGSRTLHLHNVNSFMDTYPDADGVKTGFTRFIGRTLIGSATRDGQRIYVVLISTQDRDREAAALLDWAFEQHDWSSTEQSR